MSHWVDQRSRRDVWVVAAQSARDWPAVLPWASAKLGLLVLTEHVVDAGPLARLALERGLVFASAWGPGCELIEETFDEIIALTRPQETPGDAVLTTSHADESLEETLEFFLEVATPARAHVAGCEAWVVFAIGTRCREHVERALVRRGAKRHV
jgi:hypothetical protein